MFDTAKVHRNALIRLLTLCGDGDIQQAISPAKPHNGTPPSFDGDL